MPFEASSVFLMLKKTFVFPEMVMEGPELIMGFFIETFPFQNHIKIIVLDKRYLLARNVRISLTPKKERIILCIV